MENLKDTSTAELLAEWNKKESPILIPDAELDQWLMDKIDRRNAISAELDRRCAYFGLCILPNGQFRLQEAILAIDLRDLLTWLLQKGGNDAR